MILGIDAFNLSSGGGLTHLIEFLRASKPLTSGFSKVIVWGSKKTIDKIENTDWLIKVHEPMLDKGLFCRLLWHIFLQKRRASALNCDLIFLPGGLSFSGFRPTVTMCRNMLPFEWLEMRRYGFSLVLFKLLILRYSQLVSFKKCNGLIFLTNYAKNTVAKSINLNSKNIETIPHGISQIFFNPPLHKRQTKFTYENPCKLIYVSIVSPYKHQWIIVEAVSILKSEGIPVILTLVGPKAEGSLKLQKALNTWDPKGKFIFYHNSVPYEELKAHYSAADIGIFASSCENMPNILLELMASGLPIACSDMGPMPEILCSSGVYFNPLDSQDVSSSLRKLIESPNLRDRIANQAYEKALSYSWSKCANDTLRFLASVSKKEERI